MDGARTRSPVQYEDVFSLQRCSALLPARGSAAERDIDFSPYYAFYSYLLLIIMATSRQHSSIIIIPGYPYQIICQTHATPDNSGAYVQYIQFPLYTLVTAHHRQHEDLPKPRSTVPVPVSRYRQDPPSCM